MSALAAAQARFLDDVARRRTPGHAVYARSIAAAHREALRAAYPVVDRLVGRAFFDALAERHAGAHPSMSGDLHRYGDALAGFIARDPHCASLPYLADVARLEWAVHRAGLAEDEAPFDFASLAADAPERQARRRPRLHGSVEALASGYDVVALWEANQPDRDGTVVDVGRACHVLVWRDPGLVVRVREAGEDGWRLAVACRAGTTLEALVASPRGEALVSLLPAWAAAGVLAGCDP